MKVVMVSDYPLDNPYGGLQTHVYYLARSLSKMTETHIITFSDRNEDYKEGSLNIHLIERSSILPRLFTIPLDSQKVINKINEIDPDIVHVHGTHYPYSYIARKISPYYPTLITVHGIMAKEYKFYRGLNFIGGFISYLLERYGLSKAKNIIVCSEVMKKEFDKLNYVNKNINVYVVPNGVDCNEINDLIYLKEVIHPSILFIGLFENQKGIDILIKAIKIVKTEINDIHLYLAGTGSQEANLRNLVENLELSNNIDFLGYISGKEKYSFFKSVDFCVFPSRYEPFGIVILEAMACGKPIIGSNIDNIPFLVSPDAGFLFESENEEDLALKIVKLLKNPDLRNEMSLNAEKKVKKFDWNEIALKTKIIYLELLNSKVQ